MKSLSEIYDIIENPLNNTNNLRKLTMESLRVQNNGMLYDKMVRLNGREDKSQINKEDQDRFYIETTEEWRKKTVALISRLSDEQIDNNKYGNVFRYILSIGEITTIEQKNEVYKQMISMNAKGFFWENHDGGWEHIMLNRVATDKSKDILPKVKHRLYISCNKSDLYKMMTILKDKFASADIPYYFKTMPKEHSDDSIVIYSDTENLPNYLQVLEEIGKEYPEIVERFGNPPAMTGKYNEWIGFGDEPLDENGKNGSQSYNEKRAEVIFPAVLGALEQEISDLKGKKININGNEVSFNSLILGQFTDAFINHYKGLAPKALESTYNVKHEDLANRDMIYQAIKKNMTEILETIYNGSTSDLKMVLSNGKKTSFNMIVAREAIASFVPIIEQFDPTFLDKVKASIDDVSKEKRIDIEKFCFDIGTRERFEEDRRRVDQQKESIAEEVTEPITEVKTEQTPEVGIEEKKERKTRKGPVQVYDENGNIIIHEFINPTLLERKIKLPNGYEMSAKQFIQESVVPHIPESGTFKLKNGVEISARQYIEEFIMFELEKYNGDLDALMRETLAGTDEPPKRDVGNQQTHGKVMETPVEQETERDTNTNTEDKSNLSSFRKSLEKIRDREKIGFNEVKGEQDKVALRQERGKLVSLSMRGQLDEDGQRRLQELNNILNINNYMQQHSNRGTKKGQYTGQSR